jgi:CHRD domain
MAYKASGFTCWCLFDVVAPAQFGMADFSIAPSIRSLPTQQLAAKDLAAVITAIQAGAAYANVHTTVSPGGEIRGQIRTIAK